MDHLHNWTNTQLAFQALDTFGCTPCNPAPKADPIWGVRKKKEEVPMSSYASATIHQESPEIAQREYVRDRLRTIKYSKRDALTKQFGLVDDEAPKTAAEFAKRIADGKYTIDKEKMDKVTYDPSRYIRWRDPSVVEDKAGFTAADSQLTAAYTKAKDAAVLSPIADAKAALDAFEAWTLPQA